MLFIKNKNGFSLIELLVAIAFISVIITTILTMNVFNASLWKLNEDKTKAYFYASESLEAIKLIDWSELLDGDYHLVLQGDSWELLSGNENLENRYTRNINIATVEREFTQNGHVYGEVVENGFIDPDTKKITAVISWTDKNGSLKNVTLENYLSRWQANRFIQTDWLGGSGQTDWLDESKFFSKNTSIDTEIEGVSTLMSGFLDWNQANTTSTFNLPGSFDENDVYVANNKAYLVTENNSSGSEFFILNVANIANPVQLSSLNMSSSVTSVVAQDNYAYLSTRRDSTELRVINVSNPNSPSIAASYDLSGNQDALDIAVNATELYILQDDDLHSFSISDPNNPQLLDEIDLDGLAKEVFVSANTIYVATENYSQELQIVDATNPANLQIIGGFDLPGNLRGTDIFVRGSRAYFATDDNSAGSEFFIFDISNPSSPLLLGSYNLNSKIHSFNVVGPYALLGTNLSNAELRVIDISFPATIGVVSNFDLNGYILGMSANCAVIYAATTSNENEFFIITTGVTDCGYSTNGELISSTFDTGTDSVTYNWIAWTGTKPTNTEIKFQIATSNNSNGPWNFTGPDGTSGTYYTNAAKEFINYNHHLNQRYLRYKLFLDTQADLQAPILEEVSISYSSYQ